MCEYVPQKIVRHDDGFAVVHGCNSNRYAYKKTIQECLALCIEWKRRGHCRAHDIDRLFSENLIEWPDDHVRGFKDYLRRLIRR